MSSSLGATLTSFTSQVRAVHATMRNPVDALPPEVYTARLVTRRLGRQHVVYVCAPDLVREALVSHSDHLGKGEGLRRALGAGLGRGLLTADGTHWRWQRQALAPVFRASGTDAFLPAMIGATRQCVENLGSTGGVVAMEEIMMRLTGRIIIETMLSNRDAVNADTLAEGLGVFLGQTRWSLLGDLLGTPEWLPHPGKARGLAAARALREEAIIQMARRRKSIHAGDPQPDDLLARLLAAQDPETGRAMSDEEIVDNLMTFLTAGHETTALALAWTFDRLSRHPEILRAVQREIDDVVGSGAPDMKAVRNLDLTRRVLKESMRLTPPAPIVIREVEKTFTLEGITLHPGTRLIVPIHALHRHQTLWDAPNVFDPERFVKREKSATAHDERYAYMPFGAGPRVCIGASFAETEALVIMAMMLRTFDITPVLREPPPGRMEITYRPTRPLLMSLKCRAPSSGLAG